MQKKSKGYANALPMSYMLKDELEQFERYIPSDNYIFLSTGRGGIKHIIGTLKLTTKDEILLPSYLCPWILPPIREEGVNVKFFKIKKDLTVDIDDIKNKVSYNTKALLIIHYFGFPQPIEEILDLCESKNLFLIEDCAHAFLSKYNGKLLGSFGNSSIFSYRKTLPVPDGALLVYKNPSLVPMQIDGKINLMRSLYSIMETSALVLNQYSYYSPIDFLVRGLSYSAKKIINIYPKPTNPSYITRLLMHKFDLEEIINRKRNNFRYLLENLDIKGFQPLYPDLPEGVCPLWFPVLTENRDIIRKKLKKSGISTPLFWKLPKEISETQFRDSWNVSNKILSIPIGSIQEVDMSYIVQILEGIIK